jgi:NADPH:quinone reductase-like Zn-dependent oxidoreductase
MVAIAAYGALAEIGAHNVERTARTAANLARIVDEVAAGRLVLPVAATFPLDDVRGAFAALDAAHPVGKIVVLP